MTVSLSEAHLCTNLLDRTTKYWDHAFLAGVGFALRSAHGDPTLSGSSVSEKLDNASPPRPA